MVAEMGISRPLLITYNTSYKVTTQRIPKKKQQTIRRLLLGGVFTSEADGKVYLILLDAVKGRWEFPELKRKAFAKYKQFEPETVIIEAKAADYP